jgi:Kef-type K+ transport system membrane component KefB
MNILLTIGLLLIIGYIAGWLLDKIGLPKIIGYIATGIAFSPNSIGFIDHDILQNTHPLMEVCLAFIAFEVGGALKWSKIKRHEKEIISITILGSLVPFILVSSGVFIFGLLFPSFLPFTPLPLLLLALLLGALASPTAPAATLAVMHQYKAKGKVTDTILGVTALDDVLGILLFSLTIGIVFIFTGGQSGLFGNPIVSSLYEITAAILIGAVLGFVIELINRFFPIEGEGRWIVIIFSLIIFCVGISKALQVDVLLSSMTMGIVVVNKCNQQRVIFRILERYTEDLIFLFFFLLSGLHLDMATLPEATILIIIFVVLRIAGKFIGTNLGSRMVKADRSIRKYTAGGLLPQAGVVIGLVLSVYQNAEFKEISEILLATIMGTTIIHELIGPIAAKYSLLKAGEINIREITKKKPD